MAAENIVIKFTTDTSEIDSSIDALQRLGKIDEKTAGEFKRSTEDYKKRNDALKDTASTGKAIGDSFEKGGKKAKESITSLSGGLDKLQSSLKGVAAGLVAAFSVREIVQFGRDSLKAFQDAELGAQKLKAAVTANGGLTKDFETLIKQSSILETKSIFSDDAIQAMQTAALQFGLTADSVEGLTPMIIDFASATGQDLNTALEKVIQGVNGSTRGLKEYGINVDANQTKSQRLASITDQLTNKFKGQAETVAKTSTGAFAQLTNAIDNLQERIGEGIAANLAGFVQSLTDLVTPAQTANELFQKQSQKLEDLNKNVVPLIDRYDQLKGKTNLNKQEQQELNSIIEKLSISIPTAVGEFDKYGKAISINTNAAREFIKVEKAKNEILQKSSLVEARAELVDLKTEVDKTTKALNLFNEKGERIRIQNDIVKVGSDYKTVRTEVVLTGDEITQLTAKLGTLQDQIAVKKGVINDLLGDSTYYSDVKAGIDKAKSAATGLESVFDNLSTDITRLTIGQLNAEIKLIEKSKEAQTDAGKQAIKERQDQIQKLLAAIQKGKDAEQKQEEDNAKQREELRKKELDQDLENIKLFVAKQKEIIEKSGLSDFGKQEALKLLELNALNARKIAYSDYGEKVGDVLNEIIDKTVEYNNLIKKGPGEIHPNADDFKKQQDFITESNDKLIEGQKLVREKTIDSAKEILSSLTEIYNNIADEQIAAIERARDAELQAIDEKLAKNQDEKDKREISERQFRNTEKKLLLEKQKAEADARQKENAIRRKQFEVNRAEKLLEIGASTAVGIVNVWKQWAAYPPIAAALTALFAGVAIAQTGVLLSQSPPSYFKGTLNLQRGNNPAGRDTIPIMANEGEAIIPTDKNRAYHPTIKAVYNGSIPAAEMNKWVTWRLKYPQGNTSTTAVQHMDIDYDKLAAKIGKEVQWAVRGRNKVDVANLAELASMLNDANDIRRR